jgi:predicted DNA repair protein MutK
VLAQPMTENRQSLEKLGRFLLRGLRIGASTVSIVELLRNDWTGGISAGVAWLVFLQVERRLPPLISEPED